jgi:hypothetical protein
MSILIKNIFYKMPPNLWKLAFVAHDPTFLFFMIRVFPVIDFVFTFWIRTVFYTILTSRFCIQAITITRLHIIDYVIQRKSTQTYPISTSVCCRKLIFWFYYFYYGSKGVTELNRVTFITQFWEMQKEYK